MSDHLVIKKIFENKNLKPKTYFEEIYHSEMDIALLYLINKVLRLSDYNQFLMVYDTTTRY